LDNAPSSVSNAWTTGPDGKIRGTLPWTHGCFVCGANNPHGFRLRMQLDGDLVWLQYTPHEHDVGYRHIVHGGVLMTLADEVMTWAAILAFRGVAVAAEMTTRLHAPSAAGIPLRVEARTTRANRRIALTEARILTDDGTLVASATGKYMPVPREQTGTTHEDFVISPESIPPSVLLSSWGQQPG